MGVGQKAQGNWANFKGSTLNINSDRNLVSSNVGALGLFTGEVGILAYESRSLAESKWNSGHSTSSAQVNTH